MNIIITGASGGIGYEAARKLAENPEHTILALARRHERLEQLARACGSKKLHTFSFDILEQDYQPLLELVKDRMDGRVNVLINNAGLLLNKPFRELSEADLEQLWRTNLLGPVKMVQGLLPFFGRPAHIVNIGSMGGFQGSAKFPGLAAYSSSKAALHNLTECLAEELKESGIRINCLALGSAQTEMLEKAFPGHQAPVSAADMGAYLADFALNGHRFFNGKILPVAVTTP